jgi:CheY-like chemotaxis protein
MTDEHIDSEHPTVLAVDDEERVVQAYDLWLSETIAVRTATSGEQALELLDDAVDVVLLDRRMPGTSGDEVLDEIRDGPHDPRVAMVTAVDPDFDIVDMPFDHYVAKPVDPEKLQAVVDRLLTVESYDRRLGELYAVTQKLATLETEKHREQLAGEAEYEDLLDRRETLQAEIDDLIDSLDGEELTAIFGSTSGLE